MNELPSFWKRYHEALWLSTRLWRGFGHLGPRGPIDGPPCLVIPGFLTSDRSCMELRKALAEQGWRVYGWNQGINHGVKLDTFQKLEQLINVLYDGRPVLLVGWSLGGLYARELARKMPDKVEAVATLGSPIHGSLRLNHVWRLYEYFSGDEVDKTPVPRITLKPSVPCIAFWSANDGLIPPSAARGTKYERDIDIELTCTHMGFGSSYTATRQIASALKAYLT